MNLCVAYFFDPAYFAVFVLVISQKVRFSKKKSTWSNMCVLIFLQILSETSVNLRGNQRLIITDLRRSSYEIPVYFVRL
jgi:hypothetical protein